MGLPRGVRSAPGPRLLEAIRTELFDAAITDIRMPEMSGSIFCARSSATTSPSKSS